MARSGKVFRSTVALVAAVRCVLLAGCGIQMPVTASTEKPSGDSAGGGDLPDDGNPGVSCVPEVDTALCARMAKGCGPLSAVDNCFSQRAVSSCGSCTAPDTCGGAGVLGVCGHGVTTDPADQPSDPPPDPPTGSGDWQLVWSDEFDGTAIDEAKWEWEVNAWGGGNNELQYYTDRRDNSYVAGGNLVIRAQKEHYTGTEGTREYTSARMRTRYKGDWLYGRFEVRAKAPAGTGLWPAIWMLPTDGVYGGWAASGEIDIMELLGQDTRKAYGTIHYGGEWPHNQHTGSSYTLATGDFSTEFHVFALEWEAGEMRWYVDGHLYQTQTQWNSSAAPFPAPFDERFHMILNVAVGGNWPGNPNGSTIFPQTMEVDYVRVFERAQTGTSDPNPDPSPDTNPDPTADPDPAGPNGVSVYVENGCPFDLWIHGAGSGAVLQPDNVRLVSGASQTYTAPTTWSAARITAYKTATRQHEIEKVEATFEMRNGQRVLNYNVTYVDWVGLPVEVKSVGSGTDCQPAACYAPVSEVLDGCPAGLLEGDKCIAARTYCLNSAHQSEAYCHALDSKISECVAKDPSCAGAAGSSTAEVYACSGAFFSQSPKWCAALNRGTLDDPDNADRSVYYVNSPYNSYSKWVHSLCPGLYAFPYDDYPSSAGESGFHSCVNGTQLRVKFCPAG